MSEKTDKELAGAKTEYRKSRAAESFEKKLVDLVRLQMINHSLSQAAGKAAPSPWHADDAERMRAYGAVKR